MRLMTSLVDKGPKEWRDLAPDWRMDVIYYARQGRPYPDSKIAAIAVAWAKWLLGTPLWRCLVWAAWRAVLGYVVLVAASLLVFSLLPGTISWAHGVTLYLRVALGLSIFVFILGIQPWLDARRISRANTTSWQSRQAPDR
jgi:hypothetical protein